MVEPDDTLDDEETMALQGATGDPLIDVFDLSNSQNYCRHGRFIGNPHGADYLCGRCEDGED